MMAPRLRASITDSRRRGFLWLRVPRRMCHEVQDGVDRHSDGAIDIVGNDDRCDGPELPCSTPMVRVDKEKAPLPDDSRPLTTVPYVHRCLNQFRHPVQLCAGLLEEPKPVLCTEASHCTGKMP